MPWFVLPSSTTALNAVLQALSRTSSSSPTTLALFTSLFILFYIYSTSNLFSHNNHHSTSLFKPPSPFSTTPSISTTPHFDPIFHNNDYESTKSQSFQLGYGLRPQSQRGLPLPQQFSPKGKFENNNDVFHDREIFLEDYIEMNRSFKIYVYPHREDDLFANVLLPILTKSHFITIEPTEADIFFLPFSIARLRHDRRVGVGGIQDFIRDYIQNISHKYPYWNRTGGADHFYVACHSIGRSAMDKAPDVKYNAIQVVCSSSYFLTGYIAHKDTCLPQIWPRKGNPPNLDSSKRKKLAFFAGGVNSSVRVKLVETWKNDSEIFVHHGRLNTPYADELLGNKFFLHVKGFELNTTHIGDSLYYGCIPVIIANYYGLPFADVRKHFQWHSPPQDFDPFYMVMYELWLRRSSIKIWSENS
uniref:Exostosin GT47 domain-containing protein n=1 Tax=Phaseolus vulgaris TaxID=3885 RepID=V7CUU7_PHAVU|nr:hypothetical protein PHAVU_001G112000g [Phaseolus vulgaris]ESW33952.1 hypothetical protein PHAVU_001G112000g [Phaseolus vulgaris]